MVLLHLEDNIGAVLQNSFQQRSALILVANLSIPEEEAVSTNFLP